MNKFKKFIIIINNNYLTDVPFSFFHIHFLADFSRFIKQFMKQISVILIRILTDKYQEAQNE